MYTCSSLCQCSKSVFATGAEPERVRREVEEVVGLDCTNAILASAKQAIGIDEILAAIVERIPPPADNRGQHLRALIFDSYYDPYKARRLLMHRTRRTDRARVGMLARRCATCSLGRGVLPVSHAPSRIRSHDTSMRLPTEHGQRVLCSARSVTRACEHLLWRFL